MNHTLEKYQSDKGPTRKYMNKGFSGESDMNDI